MKLDKMLSEFAEMKAQLSEMQEECKKLEQKIIDYLQVDSTQTIEWEHSTSGVVAKATVVFGSTVKIDDEGLQEELPTAIWNKITTKVVDKSALEDMVARGKIDIGLVAKHSTEKPSKPYIRITLPKGH